MIKFFRLSKQNRMSSGHLAEIADCGLKTNKNIN